jgi:hypothetical protein
MCNHSAKFCDCLKTVHMDVHPTLVAIQLTVVQVDSKG